MNRNPDLRQRAQNQQKTPETVRMDRKQHIRVGSDPEQLQLPQGGVKNKTQVIDREVLQPEQEVVFEQASSEMHPQELLTSEQDRISSQIDQFRNSIASLRESLPEQKGGAFGMSDAFQNPNDLKLARQDTKFKFSEKAMPFVTVNPDTNRKSIHTPYTLPNMLSIL